MLKTFIRYRHASLLILLTLSLLVYSSCSKGSKESSTDVYKIIPGDLNIVIGVDWAKLLKTPLGPEVEKNIPEDIKPLIAGFKSLVMAGNVDALDKTTPDMVIIASGDYNKDDLLKSMSKDKPFKTSDYNGETLYTKEDDKEFYLNLQKGYVILGSETQIKKTLDLQKNKGTSLSENQALSKTIQGIHSNLAWVVMTKIPEEAMGSKNSGGGGGLGGPEEALKKITSLDFAGDYKNDKLNLSLGVIFLTVEDAKKTLEMINAFKSILAMGAEQQDPEAAKVLNSLSVENKDQRITLALTLEKPMVDKLADEIKKKAEQKKNQKSFPVPVTEQPEPPAFDSTSLSQ